jgi:hypothetical protein
MPDMFKVVVSNDFDWDEQPPEFQERDFAIGVARGKIGLLTDMGAPSDVTVSVLHGETTVFEHSVASWRWRRVLSS